MLNLKKLGKKISFIEKIIYSFTLVCLLATPMLVLSISSMKISLDKETGDLQTQITTQQVTNQATEVKISEHSTYNEIFGTAAADGMTQQGSNVQSLAD
ncbi:hypothetical protein [Culicoidibacter larvae]|uniref:Uncharacterized protein n=1 Tax=Culicoidibacter larvae TaxID=2579976 RepID=A0A5R8Q9W0_9FIRM|nr:hypothetical protein [Culicoidibacter larvae]TLG72149.1 hypothetical protein FEZ08_09990 [Culicoidibacter larvae]